MANGFAAMTGGPRGNLSQNDLDYIFGRDGATGGSPERAVGRQRRFAQAQSEPQPDLGLRGTIDETAPALRGTLGPSDAIMGARAPVEAHDRAPSRSGGQPPGNMRSGITATAEALGINPVDLATVISYETAGTFNPTKRGPTTQWGQHRGLIQFGEPQAKKYGVDWKNPMQSQLGPDGAIVKYLRAAGVKPGMGIMDVYSAINAGGVGRYNRSDAGNGGAPGTVADKVNNQMAGHRAKAERMFAGSDPMSTASVTRPQQRGGNLPANSAPPQEQAPTYTLLDRHQMQGQNPQSYAQTLPQQPQQYSRPQDFFQPIQMPQPQQSNAFTSFAGGDGGGGGILESLFGGGGGDFWSM